MIAGGNHTSVSCREAAKGVPLVFLSCYHSTNHTPSVRPFGLPAPPPGSQVQPPLKGEEGASRRRGFRRYAEYHLECTGANSYNPLLPPLGEVPRSGKGGAVGIFELSPVNGPHPLSPPVRAASSPTGEPRGLGRIRPWFLKTAGACRTPQPLRRQLPFQGRLGDSPPLWSGSLTLHETAVRRRGRLHPLNLSGALCRELSLLYTKPRLGTSPWPGF